MTQSEITTVRESLSHCRPLFAAVETFLSVLAHIEPGAGRLVPPDRSGRTAVLSKVLSETIADLDDAERLNSRFSDYGLCLEKCGITEDHFDAFGAALLRCLPLLLGERFDSEIESAWGNLYAEAAERIIAGSPNMKSRSCPV